MLDIDGLLLVLDRPLLLVLDGLLLMLERQFVAGIGFRWFVVVGR